MADCAIEAALRYHYQKLIQKYGSPVNQEGIPQTLFVIGMGKLGAYELNLSSDIDLIFAYPETGETLAQVAGQRSISNQELLTLLL